MKDNDGQGGLATYASLNLSKPVITPPFLPLFLQYLQVFPTWWTSRFRRQNVCCRTTMIQTLANLRQESQQLSVWFDPSPLYCCHPFKAGRRHEIVCGRGARTPSTTETGQRCWTQKDWGDTALLDLSKIEESKLWIVVSIPHSLINPSVFFFIWIKYSYVGDLYNMQRAPTWPAHWGNSHRQVLFVFVTKYVSQRTEKGGMDRINSLKTPFSLMW